MFRADLGTSAVAIKVRDKILDVKLFRAFAEQAPDAILFADTRGIIRFWNERAETVFGYSPEDVLGRSLDLIIPERLREAHWHGFYRAIEFGQTRSSNQAFATSAAHQDGDKLYVELSFAIVKCAPTSVVGALGIARDVTSRYLADSLLRKRVAELESKLKELSWRESDSVVSSLSKSE